MKKEERTGFYDLNDYTYIESDVGDFIIDQEIGAVYIVEANVNHIRNNEIELAVPGSPEHSQVFGIISTMSINQFKEELTNLGGTL